MTKWAIDHGEQEGFYNGLVHCLSHSNGDFFILKNSIVLFWEGLSSSILHMETFQCKLLMPLVTAALVKSIKSKRKQIAQVAEC